MINATFDPITEAAALVDRLETGMCDLTEMGERRRGRVLNRAVARLQRREFAELDASQCSGWGCMDKCSDCDQQPGVSTVSCPFCPEWEAIADRAMRDAAGARALANAVQAYFNKRGVAHAERKGNEDIWDMAEALAKFGALSE